MVATTTLSMSSLIETLATAFPTLTFESGERFEWRPNESKIIYDETDQLHDARLLHELGHAQLHHTTYDRDIDLIAMERDAWQIARLEFAPRFGVLVPADVIHFDMDTYRDWLHSRSTCPHCSSNGIQIKKSEYKCVTCLQTWRVNEARSCQLKRYRT